MIHFIESKKFKTTTIGIVLRRKLTKEESTLNALIPAILKQASAKYPNMSSIYKEVENLYGAIFDASIVKKGEEQLLQFLVEVIKKDDLTERAIDFLKEIIMNPLIENAGFCHEIVESEKENLRKSIMSRVNDKRQYAKLRCIEESCKDEAFGIYADGYYKEIDNINSQNIYEHYKMLLETSPIEIVVIGNENKDDLTKYFSKKFNDLQINLPIKCSSNIYNIKDKENIVKEQMELTQGKLCMTLRIKVNTSDQNFYKLIVLNELLGGTADSKLFTNIREKESLCYYINSFVYRFKSIIFIESGVDEENFCKVVELVKQEIQNIAQKNVEKVDFDNAKKSLINKFKIVEDNPSNTMDFYLAQYMLNTSDTLEDVRENIKNVEIEDIFDIAKNIHVDTIYMLGKLSKIGGNTK